MIKIRFYVSIFFAVIIFHSPFILSQIKPIAEPDEESLNKELIKLTEYSSDEKSYYSDENIKELITKKKNESYNYFRIDRSDRSLWNGKHWEPADYPLSVYVRSSSSKYFKPLFRSYIDYALSVWENADRRIKFKYVSNTRDADIIINFEENLIMKYDDNYLGITDYEVDDSKKIKKSVIEIGLVKFNYEPVSNGELKSTIIHELGHALGLGHSDSETDIMFPFIDPFSKANMDFKELSNGDVEAVKSVVNLGFGIKPY